MRGLRTTCVALGLAATLGGCSPSKLAAPNLSPETRLFVQFDASNGVPHTVPYEVKLSWFGLDEDGYVVAYDLRFIEPGGPADPPWTRTIRTDSTIAVPTPTGSATPRFEVRAVDDAGAVDDDAAFQDFSFENQRPTIRITNKLAPLDTTYASVTIAWSGVDPDGDAGRLVTRVWLDGNEAGARFVTGSGFTVPSADFLQGGTYRSGTRRLYVQAIDPGGFASAPDSMSWQVRRPCPDTTLQRGRVLLVDDVPASFGAGNTVVDTLWWNGVLRNFAPASVGILRLDRTQPFRSPEDLRQTFEQFDNVVWYRGQATLTGVRALIRDNEAGIAAYLDNGGTVLLEGFALINGFENAGALSQSFMRDYLQCDSLRSHPYTVESGLEPELWALSDGDTLRSSLYPAFLRQVQPISVARVLAVRDTANVALWAWPLALSPPNPVDYALGVRALQPAGGQAIVFTTALRNTDGAGGDKATAFLQKVLLSLPGPRPQPLNSGRRLSRLRPGH